MLVVLLHVCFSVVSPIPFLLAAIFFPGHPYIGSTTVLPDIQIATAISDYTRQLRTCTQEYCALTAYVHTYTCVGWPPLV